MSNLVFPTLKGIDLKVGRSALYTTSVQATQSGKELRATWQSTPRWKYTLRFNFIRQAGYSLNTAYDEAATLEQFFNLHRGQWDTFLFTDPYASQVTAGGFGVGDNATATFQLQRAIRGTIVANQWDPTLYAFPTTPRTNLLTYSQDFTQASWTKSNVTLSSNVAIAPDGTPTASKLVLISGGPLQKRMSLNTGTFGPGSYTMTAFAKAGEYGFSMLTAYDGTSYFGAVFNLNAGTVGSTAAATTATITAIGNGWYRLRISFTVAVALNTAALVTCALWPYQTDPGSVSGSSTAVGDGASGIYVWGEQIESGLTATPYIPTTSTAVTVTPNYWPKSGDGFEPVFNLNPATPLQIFRQDWQGNQLMYATARTNLLKQSGAFQTSPWASSNGGTGSAVTSTGNFATAPDGTTTACRVQANRGAGNTASDYSFLGQSAVVTGDGATTYTESVWLKSNTGSNQSVYLGANGGGGLITVTPSWQRFPYTYIPANALSVTAQIGSYGLFPAGTSSIDILVWGGQYEVGASATGYIPTTTVAASLTDYTLSGSGLVTFSTAPPTGAVLTASFAYYMRVRFSQDNLDMERMGGKLWDGGTVGLISTK